MQPEELELQDHKGNTAFCFAAAVGNVQIAEMMERINASLPTIRGGGGLTPLHLAVLQGRKEMAWHLFPKTKEIFEEVDWTILFINCIKSGLYGKHLICCWKSMHMHAIKVSNGGCGHDFITILDIARNYREMQLQLK